MYVIKLDGLAIHGSGAQTVVVSNPVLDNGIDATGTLSMEVPPSNPQYASIVETKSVVEVYSDHDIIWRGRVIDSDVSFRNMKEVVCEEVIGYLNDSIIRPLDDYITYNDNFTMTQLIDWVLARHNEQVDTGKRLQRGTIGVAKPADDETELSSDYMTSRDFLNAICDVYGGHFVVRYSGANNLLDYIIDFTSTAQQPINFGRNLLDVQKSVDGAEIRTVIIPLGADDTTIEAAAKNTSHKYYIENASMIAKYGRIVGVENYPDIDDDDVLYTKALADMSKLTTVKPTIIATAIDLNIVDRNIKSFHVGDLVHITSPPHGIDESLQVSSIRLALTEPDKSEITLGAPVPTITGRS
jgi:phage minor structural protein